MFLLLWEVDDTDALFALNNNIQKSKNRSQLHKSLLPRHRCDVCLYLSTNNYYSNQIIQIESTRRERTVVILYHKPSNVITSHSNSDEVSSTSKEPHRRTVYADIFSMNDYISDTTSNTSKQTNTKQTNTNFAEATQVQSKLHAVGRLDADSTGLLLLTNDGALIHKATNPNAKDTSGLAKEFFQKTYECQIMGYHELPTSSQQYNSTLYPLQQLLDEGVALSLKHGGQTKPVDNLAILSHPSQSTTKVSITISEGKNRQIRRMFHAVGSGVMKLHRVSFGRLALNGLKKDEMGDPLNELEEGQWRLLSEEEVELGLGYKCRYLDESLIGNRKVSSRGKSHRRRRRSSPKQRN